MPEEIMRLLENLTAKDGENPYALSFEREIGKLSETLEGVERDLSGLSSTLENEKKIYNETKATAPEFKNSLKPLTKEEFVKFVQTVGIDYNFEQINTHIEESIATFMEAKRELLENYKSQITALEVQRDGLSKDIIENQNKLNAQIELRDKLIEIMKNAKDPESTVTKAEVYSILKECIDEKGEFIFSDEDLDIAANMIMFPGNFPDLTENKISVASIIQEAKNSIYAEPTAEQYASYEEETSDIEPQPELKEIPKPKVLEFPKQIAAAKESNAAKREDIYGPWNTSERYSDIDALLDGTYVEEEPEGLVQGLSSEETEPVTNLYDLIEELREEEPVVPEMETSPVELTAEIDNFAENSKYLNMLGLPGDRNKNRITLSAVSVDDIKSAIELVGNYGYKPRNIGEIAKILNSNFIKEAFEYAIKVCGEDYAQYIKSATIFKVLSAYKAPLGEKTYAISELFPEVIDELNGVGDNAYNPYGPAAALGLMETLTNKLTNDGFSFSIADKSIPKKAVLTTLEKLMALNLTNSDEELMLIALTYDPQLSLLDVESIRDELNQSLNEEMGMAA